jgi:hypothetical protein
LEITFAILTSERKARKDALPDLEIETEQSVLGISGLNMIELEA